MTRHGRSAQPSHELLYAVVGLGGLLAILFGLALAGPLITADVVGGVVVAVLLALATAAILRLVLRRESDSGLIPILLLALAAKAIGAVARYVMVTKLYGGSGDSTLYHENGAVIAAAVRSGQPAALDTLANSADSTQRVAWLTGYLYTVTGANVLVGYLVFAWMGFWGQVLVFFGARRAVPELSERALAVLVLFFPSLLFWPAAIGKEAWMMLGLGLAAYGAGLILQQRTDLRGLMPFGVGIAWMALIRPHIALMAVLALVVAVGSALVVRQGDGTSVRQRLLRATALVALVAGTLVMAQTVVSRFGEDVAGSQDTGDVLTETLRRTTGGGSSFAAPTVGSPVEYPWAAVTVLFRPFPWEASGFGGLLAAAESALLVGCLALAGRGVWRNRGLLLQRPFLVYCAVYAAMFVVPFSFIGNFGILARQRVQMLVFVLVLVALGFSRRSEGAAPEPRDGRSPHGAAGGMQRAA